MVTTAVSQYVDKAVGSTHRLWAPLKTAGQDPGNGPWDLEEGGGLGREPQPGPVETLDITSPLSYILHIFPPVSQIRLLHLCLRQPNYPLPKFVLYLITPLKFVNPTT